MPVQVAGLTRADVLSVQLQCSTRLFRRAILSKYVSKTVGLTYLPVLSRSRPTTEFVAVNADQTVEGLVGVVVDGAVSTIDTLAVHPDHQHRGIARTLLAHTIAQGRARRLTALSRGPVVR